MAKKVQTRKAIEGMLAKARNAFLNAKKDLAKASKELAAVQARVDDASRRLNEAKNIITSSSDRLRVMDLTGAKSVKGDDDSDVSYVIDGKHYKVKSTNNNDIQLEPVVRKRNSHDANDGNGLQSVLDEIEELSADDKVRDMSNVLDGLEAQACSGDESAGWEMRVIEAELRDAAFGIKKGEFADWNDKEIRYLMALREIKS